MWNKIARIIIRYRITLLAIIAVLTVFMAYMSKGLEPSYKFSSPIPESDSAAVDFQQFESHFEANSNAIVLGLKDKNLFEYRNFKRWIKLVSDLNEEPGVISVVSLHNLPKLQYNKTEDQFDFDIIGESEAVQNQLELDKYLAELQQYPFYDGLLFNVETGLSLTAINVETEVLENKSREQLAKKVDKLVNQFERDTQIDIHITGMPYIRTINSIKVKEEIGFFIGLAMLVTAIIMFLFFRSLTATFFSILVVGIGVIWSMGTMGILGYNITILTAMIPPLIIVIGIPNCVFLLNKYHYEYQLHGQKILSLNRVIEKVGKASLMTNLTTAAGFGTFILTGSQILVEFGIVAFINIIMVFVLSLIIIPSVYTGLKPPKAKHLRHLKRRWMNSIIAWMVRIVQFRKTSIYLTFGAVLAISIFGITKIKTSGTLTDDIPKHDPLYLDMHFVEQEMKGVLPFEILIDTKKPQGVLKLSNLKRMEELQNKLEAIPDISSSVSLVNLLKFTKQAYFKGDPKFYALPNKLEKNWILSSLKNSSKAFEESHSDQKMFKPEILSDSTFQTARISMLVKDVGADRMEEIKTEIRNEFNEIFNPNKSRLTLTGSTVIFYKGTEYLIDNLYQSLSLAILIISLLMAFMFKSWRMVLVSLIPNVLPLVVTAGIMGFFGIVIKPSTVLVFSIAFGISIDDTIHFLAKYRQELGTKRWNLKSAIIAAVRETGVSMIYTSIVLFFGFSIFMASSFGGTVALGMLVSIALLIAMLANLILLPTLLMSLDSVMSKRILKEPYFEVWDEEEDIDFNALKIRKKE